MNTRLSILVLLGLLCFSGLSAQNTFQTGALPGINFNKDLGEIYSLNFKIESREQFWGGEVGSDAPFNHQYLLTDLTLIGSRQVGLSEKVNFGYMFRLEEGEAIHRTIQQFSFISRLRTFSLGHRLVTDQTFEPEESTVFRLRYRVSAELPLDGDKADPGEFYVKLNNELLQSWQDGSKPLLEYRFGPFLGYSVDQTHKLEVGLDYRNRSILTEPTRHSYWLSINWFFKL